MTSETYLITGGAGFIGSNLIGQLASRGAELLISDWMRNDERWRNVAKHEIAALIAPENLFEWLKSRRPHIDCVIHMGAISATTETDVDLIATNNIRLTLDLLQWCTDTRTRLIYASSAATYGDGSDGFEDEFSCDALSRLRPLNAYGWSKHVVDRRIARLVENNSPLPHQWVGLKFFNVYGPNEYHKGTMKSVIAQNYSRVVEGKPISLFRSYRTEYPDGGQRRDFVYVQDCVDVILWLLDNPGVSGLFNLGTGASRTWLDLANALFDASMRPRLVEFVDMPHHLIEKYQYFTEARMDRLRAAGYLTPFRSLESGIADFVSNYLSTDDPYR
jgi:ADP-L-glycero-D-manno-heptose 6-epimerase